MSSFQTQLTAHFAAAKANVAKSFSAVDAKVEAEVADLEKIVGPLTSPLSAKAVEDAFEAAAKKALGNNSFASVLSGFVRGSIDFEEIVGPVNDKAKHEAIVKEAAGEIAEMRQAFMSKGAADEILSALPESMTAGRSKADVALIITEVRDYAVAVLDEVASRLAQAATKNDTYRDRALGLTSVREASAAFREFHKEQQAFAPLKDFDFAGSIDLPAKTRSAYPALAAAFDASTAKDLPEDILYKGAMGLTFSAEKNDPSALNHAAWGLFAEPSATADKLKEALRISMFSVRLTGAKGAMQLDTAACIAARLGLADLARDANAAANAIDADLAKDSTSYLAAIASGEEKPIASAAEIAKSYPTLVASCESASFEVPAEPVMLSGFAGMEYQADFNNVEHLNRIAWTGYETTDITPEDLQYARNMAAVGARISQYGNPLILDTLACLEHRLGNLEVGREAAKRAAEINPEAAKDSAKLYA